MSWRTKGRGKKHQHYQMKPRIRKYLVCNNPKLGVYEEAVIESKNLQDAREKFKKVFEKKHRIKLDSDEFRAHVYGGKMTEVRYLPTRTIDVKGETYTLDLSWSQDGFRSRIAASTRAQMNRERGMKSKVVKAEGKYWIYKRWKT